MTDIPFPDLPEPENPGELPDTTVPTPPVAEDYQTIKISGGDEDVMAVGISPMWDGTELDRHLFYEKNTFEPAPKDEAEPEIMPFRMTGTTICPHDGEEYDITTGHQCRSNFIPGSVRRLRNGDYVLVLETSEGEVRFIRFEGVLSRLVSQFREEVS